MKHGGASFARSLRGLTQLHPFGAGPCRRSRRSVAAKCGRSRADEVDAPVTLSAEHEEVSFSRASAFRCTRPGAHEADAEALKSGDGVAFVVYPSSGILPPYGEFRAIVTVVGRHAGEY